MALPLSPSTSYVAGSVPPVHADDLNALQVYLSGLYAGNYTVKSLDVDGTGGNAAGADSGAVRVSKTAGTTTTTPPFSMPTIPVGELTVERCVLGACRVELFASAVSKVGGFNVYSVTRVGTGAFLIIFNNAVSSDVNRHVPQLTLLGLGLAYIGYIGNMSVDGSGRLNVNVKFSDFNFLPQDPVVFFLTVVGA